MVLLWASGVLLSDVLYNMQLLAGLYFWVFGPISVSGPGVYFMI